MLYDQRENVISALEGLRGAAQMPSEYLAFRLALFRAQTTACEELTGNDAASFPLRKGSLRYYPALLAAVLVHTAEALDTSVAVRTEMYKMAAVPNLLPRLADAAAFGPDRECLEELAKTTGLSEEALIFFGRACGAPYAFRAARSERASGLDMLPTQTPCPYCGAPPGIAILRDDDGRRLLACSWCGREWAFARMQCPFCAKEGPLETIQEDGVSSHWIETCTHCRNYIKTIDVRGASVPIFPLVESVATLYLDLIAEKEGLRRNPPYVALT